MRATRRVVLNLLFVLSSIGVCLAGDAPEPALSVVGHAHMDTSCSLAVSPKFDEGIALLHNFWYPRALSTFHEVSQTDPECAMAYWGAAMTFNHPFWDAPTTADEQQAWAWVQKGTRAEKKSPREQMYLDAAGALFRDGGAGEKSARDQAYMNAMAATYAKYPDDETKLFYALSILNTIEEGSAWSPQQARAAQLIEQVYADDPDNPGALHYMIHAYDDPVHAKLGVKAARAYAAAAPAVPHALHMPSHIFTRVGYWDDSAATNEKAWKVSESDVKHNHESGELCDFHSLNYLQYAYLQLGRYRDARRVTQIFADHYLNLQDHTTAPDSATLEVRHVRGRTIYAIPDRVVYGYFDTLARYIMESGEWQLASALPSLPTSRDFAAMRLQIDAMASAQRHDHSAAQAAADRLTALADEPGQRQLAKDVLNIQAREAQAVAALASGDPSKAVAMMDAAASIEDSIYALSQPPYPPIPVHELYGTMLLAMNRPAQAREQFAKTLTRTPGRPKAIFGLASAAQTLGDHRNATKHYESFLQLWKSADPDRPEVVSAKQFLASNPVQFK
jgi:tetratricopeptide (TPR) repeat protein